MKKLQLIIEKEANLWKIRINKIGSDQNFGVRSDPLDSPKETFSSSEEALVRGKKYLLEELKEVDGQTVTGSDIDCRVNRDN
jgi:hypothetical protein